MYKVKLDIFEGPLDLLLHLIEKMEIDIHNVSILKLTESYLEYIKSVDEISLQNAEDYIVMASTLIHIKSKSLLPNEQYENTEEFYEEDLVKQLLEYKNYKEVCKKLENLYIKREMLGEKQVDEIELEGQLMNMSVYKLQNAFKKLLKRQDSNKINIHYRKEVSLKDTKKFILKYLKKYNKVSFEDLITSYDTREEVVAIFLSLLDMVAKNKVICTEQNHNLIMELAK